MTRRECNRSSLSAHPRPPYYRGWYSQHRHMSLTRLFLPLFLQILFCRAFFPFLSHSFAPFPSLSLSLFLFLSPSLPLPPHLYTPFPPRSISCLFSYPGWPLLFRYSLCLPRFAYFIREYEAGAFHVRGRYFLSQAARCHFVADTQENVEISSGHCSKIGFSRYTRVA